MRRRVLLLTLFGLSTAAGGQQPGIVGTWEVVFCKRRPCAVGDTTNAIVSGTLRFADSTVDISSWSAMAQRRGRGAGGFIRSALNACYDLTTHRVAELTFAGIGGAGLIRWEGSPTEPTVTLYRSPDATSIGTLTVHGDSLTGSARSRGYGSWAETLEDDIILGRRIGPWNAAECAASVEAAVGRDQLDPPQRRVSTALPAAIDSARRYVIAFADDSLLVPPNMAVSAERVAMQFGLRTFEPGVTVVLSISRGDSAIARAAQQLDRLRQASVPFSRITILGIGGGTSAALEMARRIALPVRVALIGQCPAAPAMITTVSRALVIAETGVPREARCDTHFPPGTVTTGTIQASGLSTLRRRDDWGDALRAFLRDSPLT